MSRTLRAALVFMPLLLAACAGMSETAAPKHDSGSTGDAATGPQLTLHFASGETVSRGQTLEVSANVGGAHVDRYSWRVLDPLDQPVSFSHPGGSESQIELPAERLGTYRIECQAELVEPRRTLAATVLAFVDDPLVPKRTHTVRVIPPPASGMPPKDFVVQVGGGDPPPRNLVLDEGVKTKVAISWSGDAAPPGADVYLRLYDQVGDPLPRDVFLAGGTGEVRVSGSFHALLIPDTPKIAPWLKTGLNAASLSSSWQETLTPGSPITGTIRDSQGQPLAGATVALHTNDPVGLRVPSTTSKTDASGAFSILVRQGAATLTVEPPRSSGLPLAQVEVPPDAQLQAGWTFSFRTAAAATVQGAVQRSDQAQAATGGSVVLTLDDPVPAGELSVGGLVYSATAHYRRVLATGSGGALVDPLGPGKPVVLPAGSYQVELWPGETEQEDQGYAQIAPVTLSGSAQVTWSFSPRVTISGKVIAPDGPQVKTLITATSSNSSFLAVTGENGAFSMKVDNQRTYALSARAFGLGSKRLGSVFQPQLAVTKDLDLSTLEMPEAVVLTGKVAGQGGAVIPGALLRVWCSQCESKEILDEGQSGPDGSFALRVPLPGK